MYAATGVVAPSKIWPVGAGNKQAAPGYIQRMEPLPRLGSPLDTSYTYHYSSIYNTT